MAPRPQKPETGEVREGSAAAVWTPLAEVLEWPSNPRDHTGEHVDRILASIERFGWLDPIVANVPTKMIVSGHGRRLAALKRGDELVPVRWVTLTAEEAELAAIAANRLQELSGYDDGKLAEVLRRHAERDREGLCVAGFDDAALAAALRRSAEPDDPGPTLLDRFLVPPFSVLDARQGYWQDRKAKWLRLGIRSELGRGEKIADPGYYRKAKALTFNPSGGSDPVSRLIQARGPATDSAEGVTSGTSIFDPVLCELAYRWFCPVGGIVFDPFAGGSVRGIVAAALGRRYVGTDLRAEQIDANRAQWDAIGPRLADAPTPAWILGDARNAADLVAPTADLVFSCPPYGDLERYSDAPNDLSTLDAEAFDAAYFECVKVAIGRLREDRFAAFLVGDYRDGRGFYRNFVAKTIAAFEAAGARLYNEAALVTMVGSLSVRAGRAFSATRKIGKTHQNFLVFVKGDPRRATEACGTVDVDDVPEVEEAAE